MNFGEAIAQAADTPENDDRDGAASHSDRLSTIPEEQSTDLNSSAATDRDEAFENFVHTYFATEDPEALRPLYEALQLERKKTRLTTTQVPSMDFQLT